MEEKIKLIQKLLSEVTIYNLSHRETDGRGISFEIYNHEGDTVFLVRTGYDADDFRLYLNLNRTSISALKKRISSISGYIRAKEME